MAYARQLAEVWKARLTVLHVVHDLSYYSGVFMTDKPLNTLQHDLETAANERLDAWREEVCGSDSACEALVLVGRPLAEISRIIRELEVDCLVIGAHSIDKPEHQLFGSTAERLLHHIQAFFARRLEKVYSRNCYDTSMLILKDLYQLRKIAILYLSGDLSRMLQSHEILEFHLSTKSFHRQIVCEYKQ